MSECEGITGYLFGHRYAPRYSYTERDRPGPTTFEGCTVAAARDILTLTDRVYHGDVCDRCGHVVNAPAPRSPDAP